MAIRRDLTDLPADRGLMPDEAPRFSTVLIDAWVEANAKRSAEHTPSGKGFRHSDAGKCARALSYKAAHIPASDPIDQPGIHNVTIGQWMHDGWQAALLERFPDAEIEVECATAGVDSIGFIDAVVAHEGRTIAIELKSMGGWGFKAALGKARRGAVAEGPKTDHLTQAALNGCAIGADEVVIVYLAKECLSPNVYRGAEWWQRFTAEWTFTRDQYEPIALAEAARVKGILALVADGFLAARKVPDLPPGSEITDPATGAWQQTIRDSDDPSSVFVADTGSYWGCDYCGFQTLCAQTEPGRIPVETVVKIGDAA